MTDAKTEAIETGKEIENLYHEAIAAMKRYRGDEDIEDISGDTAI